MSTYKNVGLITAAAMEMPVLLSSGSIEHGYKLKKVLAEDGYSNGVAESWYPGVEVVEQLEDILGDEHIDLVVLAGKSARQHELIAQAMAAGKFVRVL